MPKLLSKHRLNKFRVGTQIGFSLILLAIAIFASAYLLNTSTAGVLGLGLGLLGALCALWFIKLAVTIVGKLWRNPRVLIYKEGLDYITRQSKKRWRWRQFSALRSQTPRKLLGRIPLSMAGTHTLYIKKKKALSVDFYYQRAGELGDLLELMTAQTLWPNYVSTYQRGKTLTFGKVSVNDAIIERGAKTVSWPDVSGWEVKRGKLILYQGQGKNGAATEFRLRGMPNAHVLLMLVESIVGDPVGL